MSPYYSDDWVTIYHGDCRDVLPLVMAEVVAIVTDPPYGISYSGAPINLGARAYSPILGDGSVALARWVLDQPSGETVVFGAHEFPQLLAPSGRWFCWDKRLTAEADRMIGTPFELAWSNRDGRNVMLRCLHGGLVNANDPGYGRLHPTEKPVPMLRQLLGHVRGSVVVDPFAGSGTTLRAAKDLNRRAIGIEIEERYCEIAANRCAQEVMELSA